MHHDRHHVAVHEEAIRPLADAHAREFSAIHQSPHRIEVVDHHVGILAAAALATQRIDRDPRRDCLEDDFQVAEDLPHVVLEGFD